MAYLEKRKNGERIITYDDNNTPLYPDDLVMLEKRKIPKEVIQLIEKATLDEVQLILSNYI